MTAAFDITTAPISELLRDRAESLLDINLIEKLNPGADRDRYEFRLRTNLQIVEAIEAELERRDPNWRGVVVSA